MSLETALQQKTNLHEEEVRKLYMEMENQIRQERERILDQEKQKAERQKEDMEKEITIRDQQLQDLLSKHSEMESKMGDIASVKTLTEQENEALQKDRENFERQRAQMERELEETRTNLEESKQQLESIRKQAKDERRERAKGIYFKNRAPWNDSHTNRPLHMKELKTLDPAHIAVTQGFNQLFLKSMNRFLNSPKAAFKVTEGIAHEREDLVKQLDALRIMNQQLKDQKDMGSFEYKSPETPRKASKLGNYLDSTSTDSKQAAVHPLVQEEEDFDEDIPSHRQTGSLGKQTIITFVPPRPGQGSLMDELGDAMRQSEEGNSPEFSPHHPRVEPLGGNETIEGVNGSSMNDSYTAQTPERIFKVVFVGDSGVGKTCFLHRFCHNRFKPSFSATIALTKELMTRLLLLGVDFQVKTMMVDKKVVALQLWDTAGQERFRSITKQYFRKADGVILMYDVTSELSFINLRNWMESVREGVEKDCVLCLVGNKVDLYETEESRGLKFKDGQKLADEYGTLFFETSASSGEGVHDCMRSMAIILRDREDKNLEDALKLEMEVTKKKKCCGRG